MFNSVYPLHLRRKIIATLSCIALAWGFQAQATVILQYHHISLSTPASTSITPSLFRQHMQIIHDKGYVVLALPDVVAQLQAGKMLPDKSVVITFDDGYDSVYYEAFPILKRNQWPFTVFVATDALEKGLNGFASWEQLNEMAQAGATIANHSHTHTHFLRRIGSETDTAWKNRIRTDITRAQDLIKRHTGQDHPLLAYPYGEYDQAVKEITRELQMVGFGQQSGPLPDSENPHSVDILALPRFPFGGSYGSEEDFTVKVATKAMPLQTTTLLEARDGKVLSDTLLPRDVDRPVLEIYLTSPLKNAVQCFASGQGAIDVRVTDKKIVAQAKRALPVGRSRYNCTSVSEEAGRFYWYSQFFIRKQLDGSWYPEP